MSTSSRRPVRLLHIPKTAGTTLASSLVRHYGRRRTFAITADASESQARFSALSEHEVRSISLFIGHSTYETGIPEVDEARIVTVLRDPVSRVKSFIRYIADGRAADKGIDPTRPFSVDEFLESGSTELSNIQTKHLANRHGVGWDANLRELGPEKSVELAKERLFHGACAFGIQESFDESWVMIWQALGIKPPVYPLMNRSRRHFSFNPAQERRIIELNQLDIELYQSASVEFERRLREGVVTPGSLEDFRRRQRRWGGAFTAFWNSSKIFYRTYAAGRNRFLHRLGAE